MHTRIKDIMQEKGVTSISLSKSLGVSQQTISNLINEKVMPSVETLNKAAEILGVPLWQIFASPEEVRYTPTSATLTCPRCGNRIEIEVKE